MAKTKKKENMVPKEYTSGFKLPKEAKRVMALQYDNLHERGHYKRAMIAAELTFISNKKKQPSRTDLMGGE